MTKHQIDELEQIAVYSPEKWVDPRELEDFDTAKNRDRNYRYYVLKEYEDTENSLDYDILAYMGHHVNEALLRGKTEDFHPKEFIEATLFLITEAWSFGAAYGLANQELAELDEIWEALDFIRQFYFDLDDVPRKLVHDYIFEVLAIASNYEIDSPRVVQRTTEEQREFLWKIV
jgi:hypothetical protein